jgi:hypothetical protein
MASERLSPFAVALSGFPIYATDRLPFPRRAGPGEHHAFVYDTPHWRAVAVSAYLYERLPGWLAFVQWWCPR